VKIATLPKAIYRFNVISIKIPMMLCAEIEKNSKIRMEVQKTQNNQSNLEQKEQCWISNYTTEP
jgi:predicted ribonuclease YlaK